MTRPCAIPVVFGPYVSPWGHTHGPRAMRVALVPYESSLCCTYCPWAVRIILGCMRHCWGVRAVVGLHTFAICTASVNDHQGGAAQCGIGHPSCIAVVCWVVVVTWGWFVHLQYGVALKDINGEKMKEGRAKTSHDICRGSISDEPAGTHTAWVH